MKRLTFRQKLWLPLVLSWICLLGITLSDALEMRSLRMDERMRDLRHVSETAFGVIKEYGQMAQDGKLSADDARAQALVRLKSMRYGEDGYFVVSNSKSVIVMHPVRLDLVGKDLSNFTDSAGNHLLGSVGRLANSGGDSGSFEYMWPKPGSDVPLLKKSYVMYYRPWDWGLTTGMYVDDIDAAFHESLLKSMVSLLGLGLLMSLAVVVITRGMVRQLGGEPAYAANVAGRIAAGDLSTQVQARADHRSSMLYAMAQMQQELTNTVGHIKGSAESIASATQQIASGNMDLSRRTEQQAATLEETAASVEELTGIVKQNAENARQANVLAVSASSIAVKGGEVVGRVVETMDGIKLSSNRIGDILGVIEGIAFQTNILALNAAVEAARAGEQGRGFAVVAGEVRTLAQRCATAAREIKELIDDSIGRVQGGSALVAEAGTVIQEVVVAVKRVADIMGEISAASEEQSTGIEQISRSVTRIDEATQQNAALVEQAAAAAQSLEAQANTLRGAVAFFKLADSTAEI